MTGPALAQILPAHAGPARPRRNPFVDALEHIEYGRLTVDTPDGRQREFTGPHPGVTAHMVLRDWSAFDGLVARGEVGFAESYVDGRWESPDLAAVLTFGLVNADALEKFFYGKPLYALWLRLKYALHGNSLSGSRRNVMAHYDLGNAFYKLWLDDSMTYSGALFEGNRARTLEEAQAAKYRRILRKLGAQPGQHILEIGCGWGGFAEAGAREGMRVTALTLSPEQAAFARERLARAGLSSLATIELRDYREIGGTFDHIASIGMFEHVGQKYWPDYFRTINARLAPGGRAMVQSITLDDDTFERCKGKVGFIEKMIFPGGMLPSKRRFREAAVGAGLECREMFGFGQDYATTLRHWLERFNAKEAEVRALGFDDAFLRLWRFYLCACIASFVSKRSDVMQAELTHA